MVNGQAMHAKLCVFLMILAALASTSKLHSADQRALDVARLKEEWAKARSIAMSMVNTGSGKSVVIFVVSPEANRRNREKYWELRQNQKCVSVFGSASDSDEESVIAANSQYAFKIKRRIGNKDWVLDQVDLGGDGSKFLPSGRSLARSANQGIVCELFQISGLSLTLESLVENPHFRTTKTETTIIDGAEMIRIQFQCVQPPDKGTVRNFPMIRNGYVLLDPGHYWCLKEYQVETDDGLAIRTISRSYQYSSGPNNFPIPSGASGNARSVYRDGREFVMKLEDHYEFRDSGTEFEEVDFTLSKYGLPEPVGLTWKRRTPTYVWLLVVAGVCAFLALGFGFWARRSRPKRH